MKVAFIITNHYSKMRNNGRLLLINLINSLVSSIDNINQNIIYIIDNASMNKLKVEELPKKDNIKYKYVYIENQSIGGLTWAWNYGIKLAIEDGSDILINLNDDLIINKSINKFIDIINEHKHKKVSLFGPVTNKGGAPEHQVNRNSNEIIETSGLLYGNKERQKYFKGYPLNGFAMGFTKEMYYKYNIDGWLFSRDLRDAWGCQEDEFYNRNKPKGLKNYIVHFCFIEHTKQRSWRKAREIFNHPIRKALNYNSEAQIPPCY